MRGGKTPHPLARSLQRPTASQTNHGRHTSTWNALAVVSMELRAIEESEVEEAKQESGRSASKGDLTTFSFTFFWGGVLGTDA